MNRELKFRAWDLDNGNMYYQDRDHENGGGPIMWQCNGGEVFFEENQTRTVNQGGVYDEDISSYVSPNQKVMQYTGLKDKNGKEIYEGDILYDSDMEICTHAFVKWCEGRGGWDCIRSEDGESLVHHYDFDCMEEMKIIGNIYQNPELLK